MKKLIFFLLAFVTLLITDSFATSQIIVGSTEVHNGSTYYAVVAGAADLTTTESAVVQIVPTAGTFKNLYVVIESAPGIGNSATVTMRKTSSTFDHTTLADTSLAVTISDSETSDSDISNTVSVSAGDIVTFKITEAGTPADLELGISVEFEPDTAGETIFMAINQASGTTTRYASLYGQSQGNDGDSIDTTMIIPTTGEFRNMYAYMPTQLTSGTWDVTLRDDTNGSDTSITCQLTSSSNNCTDTSNTFSTTVSGTLATYKMAPSSPDQSIIARSIVFVPDTSGDFIIPAQTNDIAANGENSFLSHTFNNGVGQWTSTTFGERLSGNSGISSSGTIKEFWAYTDRAPGAGTSVTWTLVEYNGGSPSSTSVTLTASDTEQGLFSQTGLSVNVADNQGLRWNNSLSGSPSTPETKFSLLMNIPAAAPAARRIISVF